MENSKNNIALWLSILSPLLLVIVWFTDIGARNQKIDTLVDEVKLIREDIRERTRDRIYRTEHDADMRGLRERIQRNEQFIFGSGDGGTP